MTASLKLQHLESKISKLEFQKQGLLKQRLDHIAELISKLDLSHLDDKILAGGLLFLREKITMSDPIMEDWRQAGERFLRKHRPKRKSHSKKTLQTNATPQPAQISPQSREN